MLLRRLLLVREHLLLRGLVLLVRERLLLHLLLRDLLVFLLLRL